MKRAIVFTLLVSSCAASREVGPAVDLGFQPGERTSIPVPRFDRILGSFVSEPQPIILLTPRILEERFDPTCDEEGFASLVEHFDHEGLEDAAAAARLNWAAVLWFLAQPDRAYHQLIEAERLFTQSGNGDGLAHVHEWLGYVFRESGDDRVALDHFAVAYQLYALLGQPEDAARTEGYGD